jgi:hypothetical protein
MGECPPTGFGRKMRPSFRQSIVKCSVRKSSEARYHNRNSEGAKDIHEIVDNSVENSKPMKSDRCRALASLIFAQNLGNYLHR